MQEATEHKNDTYEIKDFTNWEDLSVHPMILRGIYAYGFEKPSPIQSKAILSILDKKDVLAQAQSGTGKTGCFTIGCLGQLDMSINSIQAMILAPTRELSIQIKNVIDAIGSQIKNLRTQLLIGGTSTELDIKQLKKNPHIVIGCPGRMYDMLRRTKLNPEHLKCIILDEADEMLSQGFKEQVYNIFQFLPKEIQVLLFSATMPEALHALTEKFMRNPIKILVKSEQLTLEGIQQYYVALENDDEKYDTLKDLYQMLSMSQCIIYCNSVRRVQDLHDAMIQDDFPVSQIHSNMDKDDRNKSFKDFSSGKSRVLISSNVTARGIDIQQVSTVINFDIPKCIHTYLHRIGRSGRWGRKGLGINFITKRDIKKLKELESYYNTDIKELPASLVNDAASSSCTR
tara:strand:- start:69 stop:1268 length:1200 start_codon:yes stop_codon:yes gene_type:complete